MSTEPMIRFSGTPVEKPDLSPLWERPASWPRIDLIPVRGLDYHVVYLLARKPGVGHGLCLIATVAGNASTWYVERVGVSADGRIVTPVEGSRQTSSGTGMAKIDYQFPEDDPVGTVYAMKVAVTDPTVKFATCPELSQPAGITLSGYYSKYNAATILEWIVRTPGIPATAICTGVENFAGPVHVAVYHADKGLRGVGVRGNASLRFIEFREGSVLYFQSFTTPSFSSADSNVAPCADWDGDFVVRMDPTYTNDRFGKFVPQNVRTGATYPLSRVLSGASGTAPFDWSARTASMQGLFDGMTRMTVPPALPVGFGVNSVSVSSMFVYNLLLPSIDLPDGFGQAATSVASCFSYCSSLTDITGNPNFKTSLSLSASPNLTHDSLMVVINGLQTVANAQTLTLGATNLAKLTDEEKKVATDKGWTLA